VDWNSERARVEADSRRTEHWSHWGPYVSARQWGTVREDYSSTGEAWNYFPFEHAAARAYRWGEDGIFGISDDHQRLCFAPAFWNERDPILKERFFGLGGPQGNHGEDVKELYYHLDNVPSHAYMRALYKYPQAAFPYRHLVEENARRSRNDPEFELVDTGIFEDDAYFDITVEYAKRGPSDILIRITATNRGRSAAPLHIVPQLWYRNQWSWSANQPHGTIVREPGPGTNYSGFHPALGTYRLSVDGDPLALFTENETNMAAIFGAQNAQPYVKDAIERAIVRGERAATSPNATGSKLALQYALELAPGASHVVRLRLADASDGEASFGVDFGAAFESIFDERIWEADAFYAALNPFPADDEARALQRGAIAGMLWSKQYYHYVIRDWLAGDPLQPAPPPERRFGRNREWGHLYCDDVLSMPDTWEYPWFAAWDLAFHTVTLALVDPAFAKRQLLTLTREWYMHPSGALPAYEWAFGDVNPPVHAWAAYRIFQIEHKMYGVADYVFLERVFQKLLMNFTWWVNREDPNGDNVFTGGFMGLDNVGIFDRSNPLPTGGEIVQSDSTSWMAVYALDMLAIALELAQHNVSYEDIASKFFEHFLYIATAMNASDDGTGLWNEEDGFYYDRLVTRDGSHYPMRVRSIVGLTPLFAIETLSPQILDRLPNFKRRVQWFVENRPELSSNVAEMQSHGMAGRRILAILDGDRLRRLLRVMFDESEFLSPNGIRSLSKWHAQHPMVVNVEGREYRIDYEPAESNTGLFGGNSNWRGPVWISMNYLIIESLQNFHFFYGDDYRIEFPTGSGNRLTLWEIATELSHRLLHIFRRDENGNRPFNGGVEKFQRDPHFRDLFLFYEYFHGDNGAGLGAPHQTGWTGLIAKLVQQMSEYEAAGKSPLDWHYDATPTGEVIAPEVFTRL
jgi:hypothetical protein